MAFFFLSFLSLILSILRERERERGFSGFGGSFRFNFKTRRHVLSVALSNDAHVTGILDIFGFGETN